MEDEETCQLKLSKRLGKKPPTLIAEFTNGSLNFSDAQTLLFQCYRSVSESGPDRVKRLLHVTNGRLNYSGESQQSGAHRYFVGVRNKASGKMKLYDTNYFRLKPILKPPEVSKKKEEKNYRQDVDDLISNFGSKTSKKIVNSRLSRSVAPKHIEDTLNSLNIDESMLASPAGLGDSISSIDYIPERNPNASVVAEVYDINNIITEEEFHYLADEAEKLINANLEDLESYKNEKTYCKYVLSHCEAGLKDFRKAHLLAYYNHMVTFMSLRYTEFRKKFPADVIPQPFRDKLLETFTAESTYSNGRSVRTFPQKMKDKLLSHMIVLALFIDDFFVNPTLVQSDMKISLNHVLTVAQVLGCYIKTKVNDKLKYIELKLPLNVYNRKVFKRKTL